MSVTSLDFLEFAKRLSKVATTEIDYRNVVSRLYYAAYHESVTWLHRASSPIAVTADIGHKQFCDLLLHQPVGSTARQLGVALNNLRQRRNSADYGLNAEFNRRDMEVAAGAHSNVVRLLYMVSPRNEANPAG